MGMMEVAMFCRSRTRGERAINWIEDFCLFPSGFRKGDRVRLSLEQRTIIMRIFDHPNGQLHPEPVAEPLAAFLVLFGLAGPEAPGSRTPPPFASDLFSVWAAAGPRLRAVLRRRGEMIECPELGTAWPSAA
jgi:hypothetical protein